MAVILVSPLVILGLIVVFFILAQIFKCLPSGEILFLLLMIGVWIACLMYFGGEYSSRNPWDGDAMKAAYLIFASIFYWLILGWPVAITYSVIENDAIKKRLEKNKKDEAKSV